MRSFTVPPRRRRHRASSQIARSIRHYRIESSHACPCISRGVGRLFQSRAPCVGGLYGVVDERPGREGVLAAGQAGARRDEPLDRGEAGASARSFAIDRAGCREGRREACIKGAGGCRCREGPEGAASGQGRAETASRREAEGHASGTHGRSDRTLMHTRRAERRRIERMRATSCR